ncbi:MAG: GreA/GreB family elongation factor [Burkholderiaceae bacterium]
MVQPREGRILTETDHVRIFNLLQRESRRGVGHNAIADLIDSAELVSPQHVPPDVITMGSRLLVAVDGLPSGPPAEAVAYRELTLCYPEDADPAAGKLSVLTPAGACLLGRKVGDVARWSTPEGGHGSATIVAVLFQPEANGDYVA